MERVRITKTNIHFQREEGQDWEINVGRNDVGKKINQDGYVLEVSLGCVWISRPDGSRRFKIQNVKTDGWRLLAIYPREKKEEKLKQSCGLMAFLQTVVKISIILGCVTLFIYFHTDYSYSDDLRFMSKFLPGERWEKDDQVAWISPAIPFFGSRFCVFAPKDRPFTQWLWIYLPADATSQGFGKYLNINLDPTKTKSPPNTDRLGEKQMARKLKSQNEEYVVALSVKGDRLHLLHNSELVDSIATGLPGMVGTYNLFQLDRGRLYFGINSGSFYSFSTLGDYDVELDGPAHLKVTDDGLFGLYLNGSDRLVHTVLQHKKTSHKVMRGKEVKELVSQNGKHKVEFDNDTCSLKFTHIPTNSQSTRQLASEWCRLDMQIDANLVAYSRSGKALWASNTSLAPDPLHLELQDNSELALVDSIGTQVNFIRPY